MPDDIVAQAGLQFSRLAHDPALIRSALDLLRAWFDDPICAPQYDSIWAHVASGKAELLLDSFYQLIPFGTGGRRGRVGYGPNRINEATVALSVQGHCNYLRDRFPSGAAPTVVVAFDTRIFRDLCGAYSFLPPDHPLIGVTSQALARIACEIYAANGFEVHVAGDDYNSGYLSTPELSFLIRRLRALGGINVSASHNHPDDNGFKFFNQHGAQDVPPTDLELMGYMNNVPEVKRVPFAHAQARGSVRPLTADLHQAYISLNLALRPAASRLPVRVMYSPLCGTGNSTVGDVLRAAGHDVRLFGPQANFDGTFASVPFRLPNPEVPESVSPALPEASATGSELVLCTDPDADRLGMFAKSADGGWRYITGNEIGTILAYYLVADRERGPRRPGLLVKTLVTTRALQDIASRSGCRIVSDLLVGFKYIADVLLSLETKGRFGDVQAQPGDLVLAAEESHGFLLTPEIRDKDAAGAALVLCDLLGQLRSEGRFLTDYLDALSIESGNYANMARSIVMRGIRGAGLLASMMASLRADPPSRIGDFAVTGFEDYCSPKFGPFSAQDQTERQARNLLLLELDGAQVVIRPSGTEPKAKVYVDAEGRRLVPGAGRAAAAAVAQQIAGLVYAVCLERIAFRLRPSAALLPDYIDLDLKADFDTRFRTELKNQAEDWGDCTPAGQLDWLKNQLALYVPGADPIVSVQHAVASLADELATETANQSAIQALGQLKAALKSYRPGVAPAA
jgi:phosphoglucomutase